MGKVIEWTGLIIIALIIATLINVFVFELYKVDGNSMLPNFHHGERVSVLKTDRLVKKLPNYMDVIIVDGNLERKQTLITRFSDTAIISRLLNKQNPDILIKRVIGKPGDALEYREGHVYRNGELLEEPYILEEMQFPFAPLEVPEGHVYVMGDNRNNSKDSRMLGPIPFSHIRGRVLFR